LKEATFLRLFYKGYTPHFHLMLEGIRNACGWVCVIGAALMLASCLMPWLNGVSAVGSYNYLVLLMSLAVAAEAVSDVVIGKEPIPALLLVGSLVGLASAAQNISVASAYGLIAGYGAAVCVVGAALVLVGSLPLVAKRRI
jgi:hypothetical protein